MATEPIIRITQVANLDSQLSTIYTQANNAYAAANTSAQNAIDSNTVGQSAYAAANAAANTVRVSQNNNSILSSKQLNFVNTATITIAITDSGNGNANIAFTSAGGGGSGLPAINIVTNTAVTAIKDNHYILSNTAASTVTLPASPTSGDIVWISVINNLITNNVNPNGNKIATYTDNVTINSNNATLQMRYVNATYGWLIG